MTGGAVAKNDRADRCTPVPEVLHLQTRAYPLHHGSVGLPAAPVKVPGLGEFRAVPGTLGSLAYNAGATVEIDLTQLIRAAVELPGTEIVSVRARLLRAGTVLLVYALRHDLDLRSLDTHRLDVLDLRINHALRQADRPILAKVLAAAVRAKVLGRLTARPGDGTHPGEPAVDPRSVRYNCHIVTRDPPWTPDPRVPDLVLGPHCQILLPYTYAWDADPAAPLDETLTMLEPADFAVAQSSLLVGATVGGGRILAELARADEGHPDVHVFRRFINRVWSDYHHLDGYRIESAQDHRATFLAARETTGIEGMRERAESLLHNVGTSLLAESSLRSEQLDGRLNRVAAALTVVTAAAFLVDLASFLLPAVSLVTRAAVVACVVVLAVSSLAVTIFVARGRRRPSATS